jgi:predicted DNA-binding transcriptional regulator AlpA
MNENNHSEFIFDRELVSLLGITQQTLNNKVYRGDDLPRFIKPRGCRRRLWVRESVEQWLSTE